MGWDSSSEVTLLSIKQPSLVVLCNFCEIVPCLLCLQVSPIICRISSESLPRTKTSDKDINIMIYCLMSVWCICLTNIIAKCRCQRLPSQALKIPLSYFIIHIQFLLGNTFELVVFSYLYQVLIFCKTSMMPFEM